MTSAVSRIAWTVTDGPRTANLCATHARELGYLLTVLAIDFTTTTADPIAQCQRYPQRKATRHD